LLDSLQFVVEDF